MTPEELKAGLTELEKEHNAKRIELFRKYALANNPHKIGDIITDHIGSAKIEDLGGVLITRSKGDEISEMKYWCLELKKDLKPKKNNDMRTVCQSNIINKEV